MEENPSSAIPKCWHEQSLLRILAKRGRDAILPWWRWNTLLNLCFLCPYLTVISLMKTRRFCGGDISFFPSLAFNMLCQEGRTPDMEAVMWEKIWRICAYIKQLSLLPIYWKRQGDGSQLMWRPEKRYRQNSLGSTSNINCNHKIKEPRKGALRSSWHQRVPRGQKLQKYLLIHGLGGFVAPGPLCLRAQVLWPKPSSSHGRGQSLLGTSGNAQR